MNHAEKPKRFLLQILNTQNATWQGTATWVDGKRQESFRSALELIRLLDSVVDDQTQSENIDRKSGTRFSDLPCKSE